MSLQASTNIDLPREQVFALFADLSRTAEWQRDTTSTPLGGERGKPGATDRLTIRRGNLPPIEVLRTVLVCEPPQEFTVRYEYPSSTATSCDRFMEAGPNRTAWVSVQDAKQPALLWLLGLVRRRIAMRELADWQHGFKVYAESQVLNT